MLSWVKKNKQMHRFAIVGATSSVIDVGGFTLFMHFGLPMYWSNFISTTFALIFSFSMNRRYSFNAKDGHVGFQMFKFLFFTGISLWIIQPTIIFFTWDLVPLLFNIEETRFLITKALAIGVGMVWNYAFYAKVVFKK
jgi:putative flippase GtrA